MAIITTGTTPTDITRFTRIGGSANAASVTLSAADGIVRLHQGQTVGFVWPATNTATGVTVSVGGVSYTVRSRDGGLPPVGSLVGGVHHEFRVMPGNLLRMADGSAELRSLRADVDGLAADTGNMTETERAKLAGIEEGAQVNDVSSVAGRTGAVVLTKADVGLALVDNTSDENKPVSLAQGEAIEAAKVRANHTGTQSATTITETADLKIMTGAERTGLAALLGGTADLGVNSLEVGGFAFSQIHLATRADLITATVPAPVVKVSFFAPDGTVLDCVEDATATNPAATSANGRKWVPEDWVSPWHFGSVQTGSGAVATLKAAMQFAIDAKRKFIGRGVWTVNAEVDLVYTGFVDFDLNGFSMATESGWPNGVRMWSIVGAPAGMSDGVFNIDGGALNGETMPAGSLTSNDLLSVSTARAAACVKIRLGMTYTGANWLVAGGDSHLFVNCSRADLAIDHCVGAFDLGIYHTSSSNPSTRRHEGVRIRGTFVGCRRSASTKRATRNVDVDIDVIDCQHGWIAAPAEYTDGTIPDGAFNGTVTVRALRTEFPVLDDRSVGITYNVTAQDMGLYFTAAEAGGTAYVSAEGRALRLRGARNNTGSVSVRGINPLVVANSTVNMDNWNAIDLGVSPSGPQSTYNRFFAHVEGIGRVLHERDASDHNIILTSGDIFNSIIVGANSESTRVGRKGLEIGGVHGLIGLLPSANKLAYYTGPTTGALTDLSAFSRTLLDDTSQAAWRTTLGLVPTDSAVDATEGRLLKVGDLGIGSFSQPLLVNLDAFNTPAGMYRADNTITTGTFPAFASVADSVLVMRPTGSQTTQIYSTRDNGPTYIRKSNAAISWGPWRLIYDQGSFLGGVSQSGGRPTGAAMQVPIANANGVYVRLANGLQICWGSISADTAIATASTTLGFRSAAAYTWEFPTPFLAGSTPAVSFTSNGAPYVSGFRTANLFEFYFGSPVNQAGASARAVYLTAVGPWSAMT